jgi:hypothetical protein
MDLMRSRLGAYGSDAFAPVCLWVCCVRARALIRLLRSRLAAYGYVIDFFMQQF